ncbi:MAG: cytochrome C oxidase subunit IV family protein [Planctomycetota bacterium]|nr:cytochrome C oxidase subunit IV family protein [Planctomycetota bacterium]
MSDHHTTASDHDHPHVNYMKIFFILLFMTVAEYFYAMLAQEHFALLVLGLMAMALFKAALVGYFFMHIKFEGRWVFALIVPACILAMIAVAALIPDIARDRSKDDFSSPDDDSAFSSPASSNWLETKVLRS